MSTQAVVHLALADQEAQLEVMAAFVTTTAMFIAGTCQDWRAALTTPSAGTGDYVWKGAFCRILFTYGLHPQEPFGCARNPATDMVLSLTLSFVIMLRSSHAWFFYYRCSSESSALKRMLQPLRTAGLWVSRVSR